MGNVYECNNYYSICFVGLSYSERVNLQKYFKYVLLFIGYYADKVDLYTTLVVQNVFCFKETEMVEGWVICNNAT